MSIELENSYEVPVPPAQAWDVLLDGQQVVPCLPGASVQAVDGDEVSGRVQFAVGGATLTYTGQATLTGRDPQAHVVTVRATGQQDSGPGTATATVRARLEADGGQSRLLVRVTLELSGHTAAASEEAVSAAASQLIEEFSANLAQRLGAGAAAAPEPAPGHADSRMAIPLQELNLSVRSFSALKGEGIDTVGQLVTRTGTDLLAVRNLGKKSVAEIEDRLGDLGLQLRPPPARPTGAGGSEAPAPASAGPSAEPLAPGPGPVPAAGLPPEETEEDDAPSLLDAAAGPLLKRGLPAAAGLAVAVWLGLRLRARRRAR